MPDDNIDELYLPMSIKILRKYLTPKGSENKTPAALDSDLLKIEDRLNLNSRARQRLRKLLFPDMNLSNISNVSDFPSPSPQKNRISAPPRLLTSKKKPFKTLTSKIVEENNISNKEKEQTPKENMSKTMIKQWNIPSDLRPKKVRKIKTQVEDDKQSKLTSWLSRDSSIFFQTPKESIASLICVQSIACTGMKKRYTIFTNILLG